MRWIKALFLILLSSLLVAGGGYGYVWYKAKSYIDETLVAILPGYRVTYENLFLDPRGEVRLEAVEAQPIGYLSSVFVKQVSIRADAPLFFMQANPALGSGDWPSFLSINIAKLRINLDADFMETATEGLGVEGSELVNIAALGCGNVREFSLPVMKAMGFPEIQADLNIRLDPDNDHGRLVLSSDLELLGIAGQSLSLEMSLTPGYLTPQTLLAASPRLQKFSFKYQDLGLASRRDSFCSAESKLSVDDYHALHLGLVKAQAVELGMEVPDSLWELYQKANDSGANLSLTLSPEGGLGSELFVLMNAPHVLAERLNLGVLLNSQRVDLQGIDWRALLPSPEKAEEIKNISEPFVDVKKLEPVGLDKNFVEQRQVVQSYQVTSYEDLSSYLQHDVRLFTYFGRQVEGRLLAVDDKKIVVLRRLDQGSASYPVDRDKLEVIEVYR